MAMLVFRRLGSWTLDVHGHSVQLFYFNTSGSIGCYYLILQESKIHQNCLLQSKQKPKGDPFGEVTTVAY